MKTDYTRCTVAFIAPAGEVLGSQAVELATARLADPEFTRWVAQDQLTRRGPSPASRARAVLFIGDLSDAQVCIELARGAQ